MNDTINDNQSTEDGGAVGKPAVMRRLSEVERGQVEAWELVFIGLVAKSMGYADQSKVCEAGQKAFRLLAKMSHKDFRNIKRHLGGA
jgi:hypothetical protein